MIKPPTFLIAENPLVDDERIFVVHTRVPFVIAEAIHCINDSQAMGVKRTVNIGASLEYGDEYVVLAARVIAGEVGADRLAKLMRRMADWYRAYLIYEDQDETQN